MLRNADQRIPELVEYCRLSRVESVMIITESHSMHLRHRTVEEAEMYGAMLVRAGDALREAGIEFGLNLWQILGHHDAGFSSVTHFGWRPMVGHDGAQSERTPCPRDTNFQTHMAGILKAYARCRPDYLFLDDDFRWHNHQPVQWGCYCLQHLEAFAREIGRPVNREELLSLAYGPGYPASQERSLWHDMLRRDHEQLAGLVEQSIHALSPHTQIGLMSSAPQVHSVEGRQWRPLLQRLAGPGHVSLVRPALGCYREYTAREAMEGVHLALVTKALAPANARVAPELETSPFTRFNKSMAHARLQMALSYFAVGPELTLDLHSFISPELEEEPAIGEMLRHARRYFDCLADAGQRGGRLRGINLPLVESLANFTRSRQPVPGGCVVQRPWECCLPQLGIPVCHDDVLHSEGGVTSRDNCLPRAISGDLPLAVPETTLQQWLSAPLLLDATAAQSFGLRGLARLVGVDVGGGVGHRHIGGEEITDARFGSAVGTWMALRHMNGNIHRLTLHPGTRAISRLLWGNEVGTSVEFGPGVTLFANALGGRVAVLPFDGQTDTLEAIQFRNYHRQGQLHAVLKWLAPTAPFVGLTGAANLAPFWKQTDDEVLLGLANLSLDPMPLNVMWRNMPNPSHAILETYDNERGLRSEAIEFERDEELLRFPSLVPAWQVSLLRVRLSG